MVDFDSMQDDAAPTATPVASPQNEKSTAPVKAGAVPPSFDALEDDEDKYGTLEQQIKTGLEGAAEGIAGSLAPLAEKALGVKEADIRNRQRVNPITHGVSQAGGLGVGMFTGTGEAALMGKAGQLATEAAGLANLGQEAKLVHKIGSEAVKQAAEMAVLQGSDEASKAILHDPEASAQSAIANVGLSAVIGGAGGALMAGAISPLWQATLGPKLEGTLTALKSRLNGDTESALLQEAKELGVELKPEYEAAMSDNPAMREAASSLRQTDTTRIARNYQAGENQLRESLTNKMGEALGKSPGELQAVEVSEAEHGKGLGDALAKEYSAKINPIVKDLDEAREKYTSLELPKDSTQVVHDTSNPYEFKKKEIITPGITTELTDKISQKAIDEGFLADKFSPEARMIRSTLKELKSKNTLGELVKLGQNIGKNTKSTLPFGMETPLSRAGTIVRNIIRDSENEVILAQLGKEGPELVEKFRGALGQFKEVAALKDELNDRLKIGGSVSGFAKGLKNMAKTDSESMLNKLKGTKDAHLLGFLQEHFPESAQKLKDFHLEQLINKSMKVGREGEIALSANALTKQINEKLSPELRDFVVGKEAAEKVNRLNDLLTRLNDANHNFSNTARTVDKITHGGASTAIGLITAMSGHGVLGTMVPIAEMLGKESSSAVRLGMLRYLGSSQPIKAEGFKAAVNFLDNTYRGQNILSKAAKAVFKSGSQVLAEHLIPTQKDRDKLDKAVSAMQDNPDKVTNLAKSQVGHYFPEHQQAISQTATAASQYLGSIKPRSYKPGPLDKEIEPTKAQITRYNRALDIAQQPGVVLQHIKDGTLQPTDVHDLQALYPGLYRTFSQNLTNEMMSSTAEGRAIAYKTKIAISLFLGQPLDSSMTPSSIMAAQPQPQAPPPQQQPGKKAGSPSKLGKTNTQYMTPGQSAEANQNKH